MSGEFATLCGTLLSMAALAWLFSDDKKHIEIGIMAPVGAMAIVEVLS